MIVLEGYTLEQIRERLSGKAAKLTVDYFIGFFSAIPDDQWTTRKYQDDQGRKCARGHLGGADTYETTSDEDLALAILIYEAQDRDCSQNALNCINDGHFPEFQQETPKARILEALQYVKANHAIKIPTKYTPTLQFSQENKV